ncbi:succinate dehydrogenase, hydrophobic membrane anchor protein [Gayadomonas joobiniege]|uniref:succinate dehydrogenase, hydrophobic membrane anchor protein n=1 Tax=Gayadomonas joobiniege TaxID=1234606 RepID=UPI00035F914E|nr:succinate dehydrogenase, hydrophobic membrane anchor protein [Gayadomonas joobiniege]
MVKNAATVGRSGPHDFILVRASAIVMLAYAIFMIVFLATTPELTYAIWSDLFSAVWVKVFTLIALISLTAHAWIGLWQVLTDYVKPAGTRLFLQFFLNIIAIAYLLTGAVVLWGV